MRTHEVSHFPFPLQSTTFWLILLPLLAASPMNGHVFLEILASPGCCDTTLQIFFRPHWSLSHDLLGWLLLHDSTSNYWGFLPLRHWLSSFNLSLLPPSSVLPLSWPFQNISLTQSSPLSATLTDSADYLIPECLINSSIKPNISRKNPRIIPPLLYPHADLVFFPLSVKGICSYPDSLPRNLGIIFHAFLSLTPKIQ